MKTKIEEIIEIPEGMNFEIDGKILKIKSNDKEDKILLKGNFDIIKEKNKIVLFKEKATRKNKRDIKTIKAKIKNAIEGLREKYVYKLQICYVHFPISVSIKDNYLIIKNFLGEKKERKALILDDVNVRIEKDIIIVESHDKEKAGQTAANIEQATRITKRDRRIFQDGIFIIEKCKGRRK
ncbi:MAG: 50S ribosomal protein L6 [Candidatus Pacearchaeota archaeon]